MIKLVLFGKYRELIGVDELPLPACASFAELECALLAHSDKFAELLADSRLLLAVNHALISRESFTAAAGDEVALMPPVTGG